MQNIKVAFTAKLSSVLKGFASAFDISGHTFKFPDFSGGFERDQQALAGDWQRVGNDLRNAMGQFAHE